MIAHKERKEECIMKNRHYLGIFVFVAVLLTMSLSAPAYAITNGEPDWAENWPYVGLIVVDVLNASGQPEPAWRGTGSLISPTVVLTAGHLTDGAVGGRIWFDVGPIQAVWDSPPGHYPYAGPDSVEAAAIYTHPNYSVGEYPQLKYWIAYDVGILILSEPVEMGEYGELPEEGLVDTLKMREDIDQVGYGVQYFEKPCPYGPYYWWTGPRLRHFAPADLVADRNVMSGGWIKLTANPAMGKGGTAFGDSGGPNLISGENTIVGVTSWGTNDPCAGVSYAQRVDTADVLAWINSFL